MTRYIAALLLWVMLGGSALAQAGLGAGGFSPPTGLTPTGDASATTVLPANGSTAPKSLAFLAAQTFYAQTFGSCVWDGASNHDVGPCVNSAVAGAVAAGGGTIVLPPSPSGQFYFATAIVNNTSGVKFSGAGTGIPRDTISPGAFIAATKLTWNGSAGAGPVFDVEPAGGATQYLYAAGLTGFAIDCADLIDTCVSIKQVYSSTFNFGQAEARKTGIIFQTNNIDGSGTQQNDVWLTTRNVSASYNATGIVLDSGPGASFNTSLNRFHLLYASYAGGDGIVLGNADTNSIEMVETYHFGTGTAGSPFVCANSAYVPPSGVAVNGACYDTNINNMFSAAYFVGLTNGATWTQGGGNTGTSHLNAVTISTNGTTAVGNYVLNFASTTGVVAGDSVNCGGVTSGVYPYTQVNSVTASTVTLREPAVASGGVNGVLSGQSCTFTFGVTSAAVPGTYTITATGAATFSITAPAGGNTQGSVAYSAGVVSGTDIVFPLTGTPVAGDTFTVVVPTASKLNQIAFVDKANSVSDAHFEPGATGVAPVGLTRAPTLYATQSQGVSINVQDGTLSASLLAAPTGRLSGRIGFGTPSGPFSFVGNCSGCVASGFFSSVAGGQNNSASSTGGAAHGGQNNTISGTDSGAFAGQNANDRGRYNALVFASGQFAASGDAEIATQVLRGTTSSTSAVRLTADAAAAGSANCFNIPNNTAYAGLTISLHARDKTTAGTDYDWSTTYGVLTRDANAASTAFTAGTVNIITRGTVTGAGVSQTGDTTNGCLNTTFTPPSGNTDTWDVVEKISDVEVQ